MILIADSGSTKTEWSIVSDKVIENFETQGLNPYFVSSKFTETQINNNFPENILKNEIKNIHFYGAGCSHFEKKSIIKIALKSIFHNSEIAINSDLLAAARSLFQNENGIAAILGTGSNSGFYKNGKIENSIPSLGYILGDYGSGANIGKILISKYLNGEFDEKLSQKFWNQYKLSKNQILESVYRKPFANKYLAGFTYFAATNIDNKTIYNLVYESFNKFFELNINKYSIDSSTKLRFVGSIAYIFSEILNEVAKKFNITIEKIVKSPMNGIIDYHLKNIT